MVGKEEYVELMKIRDYLPQVLFSIHIDRNSKGDCLKKKSKIPLKDILSFSHRLETFSEIQAIVKKVEHNF